MFSADADPARQRMLVSSDQAMTPEEFQQLIEAVSREAARLKPGWAAAVDFRGMWINSSFVNEEFRQLQDALMAGKAGKIGTLLDSDALKMRLWQSGLQTRSNERTRRYHDADEWERFLAAP
jgi:hypothetical protein